MELFRKLLAILMVTGVVNVFGAPLIDTEPVSNTVIESESAQFTVIASSDSGDLSYQWQTSSDDVVWNSLAEDTMATLDIDTALLSDSGTYFRVIVSDTVGFDTSVSVQLIVNAITAPVITANPTDSTIDEGGAASFSVTATGASLIYQWQKDSLGTGVWIDIDGAMNDVYSVVAGNIVDNGSMYRAIVTNGGGADTSEAATLSVIPADPFYYWSSSVSFIVGTDSNWANVSEDVHNFPVLIRLTGDQLNFSDVKAGGADIRMANEAGEPIPYEIEYWDDTAESAAIWVLIDTIAGNTTQTIKMFYGNASADDASNSLAVFDTDNGFAGVWHLSEAGNTTASGYKDATANGNHCTGVSMESSSTTAGPSGMAVHLDGSADYLGCGTDSSLNITDNLTLCAWVNAENTSGDYTGVVGKNRDDQKGYWLMENGSGHVLFETYTGDWIKTSIPLTSSERGSWHQVCGVYDGANLIGYKDGAETGKVALTGPLTSSALELKIGEIGLFVDRFFEGGIDEVRVSNVARSPAWLTLAYANQKAENTLVSNPLVPGCTSEFTVASDSVSIAEGGSGVVNGTATCALRTEWLLDGVVVGSGNSLDVSAGRVSDDSSYVVQFRALFDVDSAWQTENVTVVVVENIPDPIFTLEGPGIIWDGDADISMSPFITNMSSILASPAPYNVLNYSWTTSGVSVVKTGTTTNTMTLTKSNGDGVFEVRLCVNNGGSLVCDTVDVAVQRPVGVARLDHLKNPIKFQDGLIVWQKPAQLQIWNVNGELLFNATGTPGKSVQLKPHLVHGIKMKKYIVKVTDLTVTP